MHLFKKIFIKYILIVNSIALRLKQILKFKIIPFSTKLIIYNNSNIIIGNNAKLMKNCIIVVMENATLSFGENVWIGPGTVIYCNKKISIGDNTRIAHYCSIVDHIYDYNKTGNYYNEKLISDEIEIMSNVWLGAHVIVNKGVKIGENSIIGAGAVVTKSIQNNIIAVGNPCKMIKTK